MKDGILIVRVIHCMSSEATEYDSSEAIGWGKTNTLYVCFTMRHYELD